MIALFYSDRVVVSCLISLISIHFTAKIQHFLSGALYSALSNRVAEVWFAAKGEENIGSRPSGFRSRRVGSVPKMGNNTYVWLHLSSSAAPPEPRWMMTNFGKNVRVLTTGGWWISRTEEKKKGEQNRFCGVKMRGNIKLPRLEDWIHIFDECQPVTYVPMLSYRVTFPINDSYINKLSSFVEKYEQLEVMGKWATFFHGYLAGCNATLFENKTIKHGLVTSLEHDNAL